MVNSSMVLSGKRVEANMEWLDMLKIRCVASVLFVGENGCSK